MTLCRQTLPNSDQMEDQPDHDSWNNWFQLYSPKLLLCARQWTRSAADAEDAVQEAFVRYWRHQRHLPGEPMALMVTSVRRAALDLARRNDRRAVREKFSGNPPALDTAVFCRTVESDERRVALEEALARIPPTRREVVVLKIWGELTFDQIARELEISANPAASRYRYAFAALRHELSAADC